MDGDEKKPPGRLTSAASREFLEKSGRISRPERYLRAVLIEDDPLARKLLRQIFLDLSTVVEVHEAATLENAFRHLERGNVDVVLLDLNLPDASGSDTFDLLHSRFPHIPIVVATGDSRIELACRLVAHGAADYVLKSDQPASIYRRVLLAVERWRHTVPAPPEAAENYRKLEKAEANLRRANTSGQHEAVVLAKEEREDAVISVSRTTVTVLLDLRAKVEQLIKEVERVSSVVSEHDTILVRGTSVRPPMRHQLNEFIQWRQEVEKELAEHEEELDEHERQSITMEAHAEILAVGKEDEKQARVYKFKIWHAVIAGIMAVILQLVAGYFSMRTIAPPPEAPPKEHHP